MEKNELRTVLKKQKRKMMGEAALRAFLTGAAAGLLALFVLSLVYHILGRGPSVTMYLIVCLPAFAVVGVASFFLLYYPTNRRIARRLDECGLEERVTTMLEYKDSSAQAAQVQRADTVTQLEKKPKERTVFRNSGEKRTLFGVTAKELLTVVACALIAAVMLVLPYDLFKIGSSGTVDPEAEYQQKIVDKLIEELRKVVKESENEPEFEKKLNDLIDVLEKDYGGTEEALAKVAAISKMQNALDAAFETETARYEKGVERRLLEAEHERMDELLENAKKELLHDTIFDKMREIVEGHENPPEFEEQLNEMIDDLEQKYNDAESPAEKAAAISEAQKQMSEAFNKARENTESKQERQELTQEQKELEELLNEEKEKQERTDLIERLREIEKENDNPEEFKKQLEDMINEFNNELKKSKDAAESAEKMEEMREKLDDAFDRQREQTDSKEEQDKLKEEQKQMNEALKEAQEQKILEDVITKLREIVRKYDNAAGFEKELNDVIDELETAYNAGENTDDKITALVIAINRLDETFLHKMMHLLSLAGQMTDQSEVHAKRGKPTGYKAEDDLEDLVPEDDEYAAELEMLSNEHGDMVEVIDQAIKELLQSSLFDQMRDIVDKSIVNKEDFEKELNDMIDDFEDAFKDTNNTEQQLEAVKQMADDLNEAFERQLEQSASEQETDLLNAENAQLQSLLEFAQSMLAEIAQRAEENGRNQQQGEGEEPVPGINEPGDAAGQTDKRDEPVYDTDLGKVPYKDVYEAYLYEYRAAVARGEVPEELQKIMDEYFASLQ